MLQHTLDRADRLTQPERKVTTRGKHGRSSGTGRDQNSARSKGVRYEGRYSHIAMRPFHLSLTKGAYRPSRDLIVYLSNRKISASGLAGCWKSPPAAFSPRSKPQCTEAYAPPLRSLRLVPDKAARVNNRTVTMNAEETIVSLFIVHRSPYSVSRLADILAPC